MPIRYRRDVPTRRPGPKPMKGIAAPAAGEDRASLLALSAHWWAVAVAPDSSTDVRNDAAIRNREIESKLRALDCAEAR